MRGLGAGLLDCGPSSQGFFGPSVRCLLSLILLTICVTAAAQETLRYISDELAIVLRQRPSADAASLGALTSGARLQLLESDAASGYARVRTADGREGWVLERYLKAEPIARERLQRAEKALAAAEAELKKLREDHEKLLQDFSRISGGQPIAAPELVKEAEDLRARLEQRERELETLRRQSGARRAEQTTLLLGGGLVAGGFLLALLLRWLWPKRRWGDL